MAFEVLNFSATANDMFEMTLQISILMGDLHQVMNNTRHCANFGIGLSRAHSKEIVLFVKKTKENRLKIKVK